MLIEHPSITREMLGADWANVRHMGEESFDYSPDISPVILAAHCNQFEILQLLLLHGATIERPHQLSCSCKRCQAQVCTGVCVCASVLFSVCVRVCYSVCVCVRGCY